MRPGSHYGRFSGELGRWFGHWLRSVTALLFKKAPDRLLDAMLGFAGGVVIAASMCGLLVPSFRVGGVSITVLGFLLGVAFLEMTNLAIPHWHRLRGLEGPSATLRRVWLLILAMGIHNIPEGLAVGISFGGDDLTAGLVIAMGIGLQNLPEGLAIAFPMIREGYSRWRAVLYFARPCSSSLTGNCACNFTCGCTLANLFAI